MCVEINATVASLSSVGEKKNSQTQLEAKQLLNITELAIRWASGGMADPAHRPQHSSFSQQSTSSDCTRGQNSFFYTTKKIALRRRQNAVRLHF